MKYSKFFCKVYEQYGWNYFSETFGEVLISWLEKNRKSVFSAVDLGCGTGILCSHLAEKGIQTIGVDISEGMIEIASRDFPDLSFEVGDMTIYQPPQKVDLVTCVYDAINHIHEPEEVSKVFNLVYDYLKEDGIFIFDFLQVRDLTFEEPVLLEESSHGRIQFQVRSQEADYIELSFEHWQDDRLIEYDTIREKLYQREWLVQMLRKAGFEKIDMKKHLLDEENDFRDGWIVVAKKELIRRDKDEGTYLYKICE